MTTRRMVIKEFQYQPPTKIDPVKDALKYVATLDDLLRIGIDSNEVMKGTVIGVKFEPSLPLPNQYRISTRVLDYIERTVSDFVSYDDLPVALE